MFDRGTGRGAELACRRLVAFGAAAEEDEVGARFCDRISGRSPETGGGTGDEDRLPREVPAAGHGRTVAVAAGSTGATGRQAHRMTEPTAPRTDLDMSLREAMSTQRAIRRLTEESVSDELLAELLTLATRAPTAQNHQSWEFIVVRDPGVKARLGRINRRVYRFAGPVVQWLNRNDERFAKVHRATTHQVDHFEEIPVLVVCCTRTTRFALASDRGGQLLRIDLPGDPESTAGRPRWRAWERTWSRCP